MWRHKIKPSPSKKGPKDSTNSQSPPIINSPPKSPCAHCRQSVDDDEAFECAFWEHSTYADVSTGFYKQFAQLSTNAQKLFTYSCSECCRRHVPTMVLNSYKFLQKPDFAPPLPQPVPLNITQPTNYQPNPPTHPSFINRPPFLGGPAFGPSILDSVGIAVELQERSTRAIGFNIGEITGSASESRKSDLSTIRRLAEDHDIDPDYITDCYRLGRKDDENRKYARLMKIQFVSSHARNEWLRAFQQTRPGAKTKPDPSRIWFRRDLSEEERRMAYEERQSRQHQDPILVIADHPGVNLRVSSEETGPPVLVSLT